MPITIFPLFIAVFSRFLPTYFSLQIRRSYCSGKYVLSADRAEGETGTRPENEAGGSCASKQQDDSRGRAER